MVIDLNRCAGCNACSIACKYENSVPIGMFWRRTITISEGEYPGQRIEIIPRPCMMCENAPCVSVCPTGASYYDEDGLVQIDYKKCIGCKYCIAACPYGARQYNYTKQEEKPFHNPDVPKRPKGVVEKCTFCKHRLKRGDYKNTEHGRLGRMTACAQICPTGATWFGDLEDPNSQVAKLIKSGRAFQLLSWLGTKPRVYYLK